MKIPPPVARRKARIEIIPLIDIIFFLLATFVMVSLSMVRNEAVAVHLPVASSGSPEERKDAMTLTVTEQGEFFLNRERTDLEKIRSSLREMKDKNPEVKVFINGDEKAMFGQ